MTHLDFRKTFLTVVYMVWRKTECSLVIVHTKGLNGLNQSNTLICSAGFGKSLGVKIRGGRNPGFQPWVIGWIVVPFSKIAQKRRENLGVQMNFWFWGVKIGCPSSISTGWTQVCNIRMRSGQGVKIWDSQRMVEVTVVNDKHTECRVKRKEGLG